MVPPELQALLSAYQQATGFQVSLSYERKRTLSDLHARGITPADVTGVLNELKRLIQSGTKGYSDSSLDWRNAMGNPDTVEERVLRLRQRHARKPKPVEQVQHERQTGNGTIRVLEDPVSDRSVPAIDVRAGLLDLANSLKQKTA